MNTLLLLATLVPGGEFDLSPYPQDNDRRALKVGTVAGKDKPPQRAVKKPADDWPDVSIEEFIIVHYGAGW